MGFILEGLVCSGDDGGSTTGTLTLHQESTGALAVVNNSPDVASGALEPSTLMPSPPPTYRATAMYECPDETDGWDRDAAEADAKELSPFHSMPHPLQQHTRDVDHILEAVYTPSPTDLLTCVICCIFCVMMHRATAMYDCPDETDGWDLDAAEADAEELCNCRFSLAYGGKILLNSATLRLVRCVQFGGNTAPHHLYACRPRVHEVIVHFSNQRSPTHVC